MAFGGHHYALIEQPAVPWHVAQDLCASQGGHLVRIESLEEYEFVKTLVAHSQSPLFWIDGNDEASEGVWVDAEGEPLTYLPWPGSTGQRLGMRTFCDTGPEVRNSPTFWVGFARPSFVNGIGNPWPRLTRAFPGP